MKKLFVAAVVALTFAGAAGSALAEARQDRIDQSYRTDMRRHHHNQRQRCRPVYRNKVVWKNHHRQVVRVRVGTRCN